MPVLWLQLENRPWDTAPNNIDRLTGQSIELREAVGMTPGPVPISVHLASSVGGPGRNVTMFKPLRRGTNIVDALIYRRYKPPVQADMSDAWTVPDDRKVNPWDLNEPNPGENGTMGTIPGPVIEGKVGDSFTVHFRNMDMRRNPDNTPKTIEHRCHSIHPHGVVFQPEHDGAYPLSPPDSAQPIGSESVLWNAVPGFSGPFKKGDRVPPGGTFVYQWSTFGWASTGGIWLYHDHSICDHENMELGAIGIIALHNAADPENVDLRLENGDPDPAFLPGGSPTGSPVTGRFFPFPTDVFVPILKHQLAELVVHSIVEHSHEDAGPLKKAKAGGQPPATNFVLRNGDLVFQVNPELTALSHFFLRHYRTPPSKMLILQLFHTLTGGHTCINGRQYLGNAPTIVAGPDTQMRFGVVGMGSDFHTFHLHGHRWIMPGPQGNNLNAIQNSVQDTPVSQFEDTRTFGPANSFFFNINGAAGSFMRAGGPAPLDPLGEWHMHCHVLMHMMTGMMGSLLIVKGGESATTLPRGVPCPPVDAPGGNINSVVVTDFKYTPVNINIAAGQSVTWVWQQGVHSATADDASFDSGVSAMVGHTFTQVFPTAGVVVPYHCTVHGMSMSGTVTVT